MISDLGVAGEGSESGDEGLKLPFLFVDWETDQILEISHLSSTFVFKTFNDFMKEEVVPRGFQPVTTYIVK